MKQYTKKTVEIWSHVATALQFGSVFAVLASLFILDSMKRADAKMVIIPLAVALFVLATIAFIVANKALRIKMAYFKQEADRIDRII